nr:TonB-dependent receptor [Gammaproteobacteria bacterium]
MSAREPGHVSTENHKHSNHKHSQDISLAIRSVLSATVRRGVPALALGALAMGSQAHAQSAEGGQQLDEIVVTGIRYSLESAQEIKRNAEVFVDAVTAEDIGALPDRSVTEVLQRIPGVAITRFAAGNDPDHFSVEGSGVVVRGLNAVRSELNGRDTFSANNGRFLSFADVPPELMGGVDVYKNQSADMIEGGLAGTVNLRTRVPFDSEGRVTAASLEANYGDFAEEWSPTASALYSDRWLTNIGEFGILVNGVYSELKTRSDGIQASSFRERVGRVPGDPTRAVWFPSGAAFRSQITDRERIGAGFAAQWASTDDTMLATLQFLRSDARVAWTEHAVEIATDVAEGDGREPVSVEGTTFGFDDSGIFTNGVITVPVGWRDDQLDGRAHRTPIYGLQSNNIRRDVDQRYVTSDYGFNFKWTPNERWAFNFDLQHVDSTVENVDFGIWGSTFQNVDLDLRGSLPRAIFLPPSLDGTVAQCPTPSGDCPTYFNAPHDSFADPYNSFWRAAMDHIEDSEGQEDAARFDVDFRLPQGGWIDGFRAGARYAQRDQITRFSTYNWGALSEIWGQGGPVWFNDPVDGLHEPDGSRGTGGEPTSLHTELFTFDNFMRGKTPVPVVVPFYRHNLAKNYDQAAEFAMRIRDEWGRNDPGDWERLDDPRRGEHIAPGSPFLPREVNDTSEKTEALYFMMRFGQEFDNGRSVSGNVGVRWVRTKFEAKGTVGYLLPSDLVDEESCEEPTDLEPGQTWTPPPFCRLPLSERERYRAFATGQTVPETAKHSYENWLPSFNLKVNITPQLLFRFGFSKAIARPDLGLTRHYFSITPLIEDNQWLGLQASTGNAFLKPTRSTQFDASLEWYFDERLGSLTLSLFHKTLKDVLTNGTQVVNITAGGETFPVEFTRPVNSSEKGKIKGFELAYTQFYDMLPAPFDGFGIQANYTYIDSKGVKQSTLDNTVGDPAATQANVDTSLLPLVGLSKDNANIAAIYEKGPISARLAYSWRSEFLLTTRDVITPFAPILNEDTGQLDGSFMYTLNDNIKIGVQGVNLLNEVTKTRQILNDDLLSAPRSWFMNDRRYSLIVRLTF